MNALKSLHLHGSQYIFFLFVYFKGRESQFSIHWFTSQLLTTAGPGLKPVELNLGLPLSDRDPIMVAITRYLPGCALAGC